MSRDKTGGPPHDDLTEQEMAGELRSIPTERDLFEELGIGLNVKSDLFADGEISLRVSDRPFVVLNAEFPVTNPEDGRTGTAKIVECKRVESTFNLPNGQELTLKSAEIKLRLLP